MAWAKKNTIPWIGIYNRSWCDYNHNSPKIISMKMGKNAVLEKLKSTSINDLQKTIKHLFKFYTLAPFYYAPFIFSKNLMWKLVLCYTSEKNLITTIRKNSLRRFFFCLIYPQFSKWMNSKLYLNTNGKCSYFIKKIEI